MAFANLTSQAPLDEFEIRREVKRHDVMSDQISFSAADDARLAAQKLVPDAAPLRGTTGAGRCFAVDAIGEVFPVAHGFPLNRGPKNLTAAHIARAFNRGTRSNRIIS